MSLIPKQVRPSDLVYVVAPSSPFPREGFLSGLAWLRGRYRVRLESGIFDRDAYCAGADDRRLTELNRAIQDPEVCAIVAARGGFGATRVLENVSWKGLAECPKWLVGFSDITALHVECSNVGMASIHGPNVTGLGHASPRTRLAFMRALEQHTLESRWKSLQSVRGGDVFGTAFGGNLALLQASAAMNRLRPPADAVWFIEDTTEKPYRIDRMLVSLRPHLRQARGIVFGDFVQCDANPDGRTWHDVIANLADELQIPVWTNAPFGHGSENDAFVIGSQVQVRQGRVAFSR